ncbi:MAG: DUF2934 domain-containing protein [Alphaproteobacteria bacterium]|nr:DUF2934 domain-containing protein [Alphaproteobacteria bacterium]
MTTDGREQASIRERAFVIWEDEGRPEGASVAHWLRAEAEFKAGKVIGVTVNGPRLKSSKTEPGVLRRRRSPNSPTG